MKQNIVHKVSLIFNKDANLIYNERIVFSTNDIGTIDYMGKIILLFLLQTTYKN